jgi:hypothetical protein
MDKELEQLIYDTLRSVNFEMYTTDQKRTFFTGLHTATLIAQSGHEARISLGQVLFSLGMMNHTVAEIVQKEMLDNKNGMN